MTDDLLPKLPIPLEVTDFGFLQFRGFPTHVVLEMRTRGNPVRFFLTKAQAEALAAKAKIAASKIQDT